MIDRYTNRCNEKILVVGNVSICELSRALSVCKWDGPDRELTSSCSGL
jgi:hypothetical protein